MARSSKEILKFLFIESQEDQAHDENAGDDVAQDMDELQKQLEKVEDFENLTDVMATDKSKLEPHFKPLVAKLKEIGIEDPEPRLLNNGEHFILSTQDENQHHNDLAILQDITVSDPLLSAGFIPLNGESDRDDNGLARFSITIIK